MRCSFNAGSQLSTRSPCRRVAQHAELSRAPPVGAAWRHLLHAPYALAQSVSTSVLNYLLRCVTRWRLQVLAPEQPRLYVRRRSASTWIRACTEADSAVVLNLRRGPSLRAARADGQLTRRASTTTPIWALIREGPTTTPLPAGRRAPADQVGHLPRTSTGPRAGDHPGRRRSGRNAEAGYGAVARGAAVVQGAQSEDRGQPGTCKLDHVVPVSRFAGSVQILQALCGDCHSKKTLRESAQPRMESRVAPALQSQTLVASVLGKSCHTSGRRTLRGSHRSQHASVFQS